MFLSESEPHMEFPAWENKNHKMSTRDMERMAVKDGFPGGPEEALENLWTWFQKTHGRRNRLFQPIFWRGPPLKIEGKTSELRELLLHTTYNVSGTAWPLHWIWGVIY